MPTPNPLLYLVGPILFGAAGFLVFRWRAIRVEGHGGITRDERVRFQCGIALLLTVVLLPVVLSGAAALVAKPTCWQPAYSIDDWGILGSVLDLGFTVGFALWVFAGQGAAFLGRLAPALFQGFGFDWTATPTHIRLVVGALVLANLSGLWQHHGSLGSFGLFQSC